MELTPELKQKFEEIISNQKPIWHAMYRDKIIELLYQAYLLDRNEWVSVDILLPTQNGDYIISGRFTKDCPKEVYQAYYDHKKRRFSAHGIISKDVTHWQPLPKKPNQ